MSNELFKFGDGLPDTPNKEERQQLTLHTEETTVRLIRELTLATTAVVNSFGCNSSANKKEELATKRLFRFITGRNPTGDEIRKMVEE